MESMTRAQIIDALVRRYNAAYAEYQLTEAMTTEAFKEGDEAGFEALARRASLKSYFLDGMKTAAEALGIGNDEFMSALGSVRKEVNT